MPLTINIPVVVVVVIGLDVSLNSFFSQSYHDCQLSLLRSISGLPVLSEHHVLSPVTENQWQGGNNLHIFMKVRNLIPIKAHVHSNTVHSF